MEKEEIYIPPPCLEISYVLTMIAYENRSYISHMPGTLKPHTCIFFQSILTVALCCPHLARRSREMNRIQACAQSK